MAMAGEKASGAVEGLTGEQIGRRNAAKVIKFHLNVVLNPDAPSH